MLVWLAPVVVFGVLVFVHELGHFLAAKAAGVYTPRFSIGFGPAIARWRHGETEYRVGILPLGGYVRMASRLDEGAAGLEGGGEAAPRDGMAVDPEAMVPFGPRPVPAHRWFESKRLAARLGIMLAGVTMNFLLGWGIDVALARNSARALTTRVDQVLPGRPAAAAGLVRGDSLIAVNGRRITSWDTLLTTVGASAGVPLRFDVLSRTGVRRSVTITPVADSAAAAPGDSAPPGRIGVAAVPDPRPAPWGTALRDGTRMAGGMAMLVFTSLRMIATREAAVSDLSGPVGIAQYSVQAARQGWQVVLYLLALLSINLAVFNLLPIPVLDGGQIAVQLIEAARGRPLTDRAREYVLWFGLALILLFFLTVTFNDLHRLAVGAAAPGS